MGMTTSGYLGLDMADGMASQEKSIVQKRIVTSVPYGSIIRAEINRLLIELGDPEALERVAQEAQQSSAS